MLRPRIIPCLLIKDDYLVKTVNFTNEKYLGDPLNAVKIFNEKFVDELMIIDISASSSGKKPNLNLIAKLANESRMPLSYGGGVKSAKEAREIIGLGVEKICLSSSIINNPDLCIEISKSIGSQSLVAVLDIKKNFLRKYQVVTNRSKTKHSIDLMLLIDILQKNGVGELVINSVDNDGLMKGYDLNLIQKVYSKARVPLTVLGGAGSLDDMKELINRFGIIGCAAGSLFVFKGKYKAVLINYPSFKEKKIINL